MNHDDYELDYIADSQQGFKKVDLYDCCDLLNENEQLKQDVEKWKDKYSNSEIALIYEYSTNINEDLESLKRELDDDGND